MTFYFQPKINVSVIYVLQIDNPKFFYIGDLIMAGSRRLPFTEIGDQPQLLRLPLFVPPNMPHPPIENDHSYLCGFICSLMCFVVCGSLFVAAIDLLNPINCDQFKDAVSLDNCENQSQLNAQLQKNLAAIGGAALFILLLAIFFTGYKLKLCCRSSVGENPDLLVPN